MSNGYWWCAYCDSVVEPIEVTYEEDHQICGGKVTWIDDNCPSHADLLEQNRSMLEALNALAYAYGKKESVRVDPFTQEDAVKAAWKMAMKVLAEVADE